MSAIDPRPEARVFTPFDLNGMVNAALEDNFRPLWIEGELGDVSEKGGHVWFSLRDARASVRGVMFQNDVRRVRHLFEDGRMVRLRVTVGLYVPRGTFQIRALVALPAGEGDRAAEVERIRKKLSAEGLMAPERKRPLPPWPRAIGVVTSKSGAALHDVLEVLKARMPVRVVLAHASVQGVDAPTEIVGALRQLYREPGLDLVIVARGGGASEDLSAFDDERVARAVAKMNVPVVSGVGHDTDVTTVDLVADVRAATPSHAAEVAVPARARYLSALELAHQRLDKAVGAHLTRKERSVEQLRARLTDPDVLLLRARGRLERAGAELVRRITQRLAREGTHLGGLREALAKGEPKAKIAHTRGALSARRAQLETALREQLARHHVRLDRTRDRIASRAGEAVARDRAELGELAAALHALSPLGVLGRGYAIALHEGKALRRASDARPGDPLELVLEDGRLRATAGEPIEE